MEERLKHLVGKEVITEEDAKVLLYISKGQFTTEISLLDLTLLENRLKMYLRSTTDKNKRALYCGFIGLVNKFIEDWGTESGKQYFIM